ncbi:MAG: hypothetical protein E4H17_03300 [Gemmatimonadales bacterium]|nr:MAG: hypothetical protein E4H17_03300 [Gemmatimonadales bacterium]
MEIEPADGDLELVALCTVETPIEAQVLAGLLGDQGIANQLVTWHSTPYDGIFESQRGHAELRVYRRDLESAREVLADFQSGPADAAAADEDPGQD